MSRITIKQWLTENKKNYTDRNEFVDGCVNALGVSKKSISEVIPAIWPGSYHTQNSKKVVRNGSPTKRHGKGMNRTQLLERYDVNTKLRNALQSGVATLIEQANPEDDESLEDVEFRMDRCQSNNVAGWRTIAAEPEFAKYQFRISDKIFWTTPRNVEWAIENIRTARRL